MGHGAFGALERAALALALSLTISSRSVWAQPAVAAAAGTESAAETYDEAVRLFDAARYAEAARAFLRADELSPSAEALESAIAAARRANEHLLVVAAAQRAIAREPHAPELAAGARLALAEAELYLVRLDLSCAPAPCTLGIDGGPAEAGTTHLSPGTHTVSARDDSGASAEERLNLAAGSRHRLELDLRAKASVPSPATVPLAKSAAERSGSGGPRPLAEGRPKRPLRPWAFYTGAGVTGALVVVTTWSGVDALVAAGDYEDDPARTGAQKNGVEASIRRTDLLLLGTAFAAGVTTYVGLALVDWNHGKSSLRAAPMLGRTGLLLSGELE